MRTITVARKPLAESSVASNVLVHECGALNIDGCRVGFTPEADAAAHASEWDRDYNPEVNSSPIHTWDQAIGNHPGSKRLHGGGPKTTGGRWPANLILVHKPGCRRVGTKKVKGNRTDTRPEGDGGKDDKSQWRFRPTEATRRGFSDEDGTETITARNCAPGCPVARLDEQSIAGGIHSAGIFRQGPKTSDSKGILGWTGGNGNRIGDSGGASRFFKQVQADEDQ